MAVERKKNFCPNCGTELSTQAKFCQSCGASVEEHTPQPEPVYEPRQQQTTLGSNPLDITLYGDSLREWREWVASLKQEEKLLGAAIMMTKVSVYGSAPLWILAVLVCLPLTFLDILTFRLLCAPLRMLLAPLIACVRTSSAVWVKSPGTRPFLILTMPIVAALSVILIHLIPHESDIRATKEVLVELWPLTERRLEWIATRGNGKAAQEAYS